MSDFTIAQLPVSLLQVTLHEGSAGRVIIVVTDAKGRSQQIAALNRGKLQLFRLGRTSAEAFGLEITKDNRICIINQVDNEDND